MPIVQTYQKAAYQICVWELTETTTVLETLLGLSAIECTQQSALFKHEPAYQNWLASRILLQSMTQQSYTAFIRSPAGKLQLPQQAIEISISHSAQWVAVATSPISLGIDIQIPSTKLERIASKYIAAQRLEELQQSVDYIANLHWYWGIKEALFKAYGVGQIDFRKHLQIVPFELNSGQTVAQVVKSNFEGNYQIEYWKQPNYYLCIAYAQ